MQIVRPFRDFLKSEQSAGVILILCTIISLAAANTFTAYAQFWNLHVGQHTLTHWINDGLMTVFFLLVGLELKREIYTGGLSTFKRAALPGIAALGGMIVPALIYLLINLNSGDSAGIGIPMATDIAFALAVLSLVGSRIPASLKIFLTALAVIDDLGAILVIAVFYTDSLDWINLGIAIGISGLLFAFNRLRIDQAWPYLIGGLIMWYFMLGSGVHATVTGVIVAFMIPHASGNKANLSSRLEHVLQKPVAFIILPLFALANTCIILYSGSYDALTSMVSIGIIAGLFVGKPVGIFLFTWSAVKLKLSELGNEINWMHIFGAGILGGIGFTMSIFISLLAFADEALINEAKLAVMVATMLSGIVGFIYLRTISRNQKNLQK